MKSNSFYREFEDRYRGSREQILARLQVYLPWMKAVLDSFPGGEVLDLGCGRGEWLEFSRTQGFRVMGIDQDPAMLAGCSALQLPVQCADAIAYLQNAPADSYVVVSAFHLVEHLNFEQLQILVRESLRVLKPAGLLILETPNPENLTVSSCSFYLDPSHLKPLPPQLLAFLPEQIGFSRVKIMRMQEPPYLHQVNQSIGLQEVIGGVSPDYAVIAQKEAALVLSKIYDTLFVSNYGFSLDDLVEQYVIHTESRFEELKVGIRQAQNSANQAQNSSNQALAFIGALKATMVWRALDRARKWMGKKKP